MKAFRIPRSQRTQGFSLVELMVGIAIGMIAIVVVMQTLLTSEAGKRLESSGNDATTSGALAMNTLLRDVRQAGSGFNNKYLLGCQLALSSGYTLGSLGPVTINATGIPAGDANTDTLLVVYGASNGSPDGDSVTAQSSQNAYTVATPYSFASDDEVVARPIATGTPCSLTMEKVISVDTSTSKVTVATGVASMLYGTLYDLGNKDKFRAQVYAVRSGNLTVCDYMQHDCSDASKTGDSSVWVPIADNIVSLRALYGEDTATGTMDGVVDVYNQTTPDTTCKWFRVPAVEFVVVARSSQYDKDSNYTFDSATLSWDGNTKGAPVDVSSLTNYLRYHYKMYQATVPLRNIGWQGVQSGC